MTSKEYKIYINPKNIDIKDRGFNFGDGVFETVLVKNNSPKNIKEHIKRLQQGCELIKIKPPSLELILSNIRKAILRYPNCILKIYVTRGSNEQGYLFDEDIVHNIYFRTIPKIPSIVKITGLNLKVSKNILHSNRSFYGIKHMNRLEQSLVAHELLDNKKYDDMLLVNDKKNIIETISSNIFFVKKVKSRLYFYTPKIDNYGIEGVMRNQVIKWLRKKSYRLVIGTISLSKVREYDYCFITNSIKGLRFVNKINSVKFSDPDPILRILEGLVIS